MRLAIDEDAWRAMEPARVFTRDGDTYLFIIPGDSPRLAIAAMAKDQDGALIDPPALELDLVKSSGHRVLHAFLTA